jgi:hypothetical protein
MKETHVFLVLLIACFSCGTNNKPLSDTKKEKIKGEVKEVVNTIIKGAEEANFEKMIAPLYNSPDFVFYTNGLTFKYQDVLAMKSAFDQVLNQKITIIDEKYTFLDNSSVIYTSNITSAVNYKDGRSTLLEPEALEFIFKKIDSKWKIIHYCDSYGEKTVKYKEPSKELNQVEVSKYFLGTWQCEMAKDTFKVCTYKQLGTGMECNIKIVTKGKTLQEGKLLYGYDTKSDKFIQAMVMSGSDIFVISFWFTSKTTGEGVLLKDIFNPDNANLKFKLELKSPNLWSTTVIENNKTISTATYHRVKS